VLIGDRVQGREDLRVRLPDLRVGVLHFGESFDEVGALFGGSAQLLKNLRIPGLCGESGVPKHDIGGVRATDRRVRMLCRTGPGLMMCKGWSGVSRIRRQRLEELSGVRVWQRCIVRQAQWAEWDVVGEPTSREVWVTERLSGSTNPAFEEDLRDGFLSFD